MRLRDYRSQRSWAKGILLPVVLLLAIGTVLVFTSTSFLAETYGLKGGKFYFLMQHLLRIVVGLLGLFFFMLVPVRVWRDVSKWLLIFSILLLLILLLLGKTIHGSKRWIHLLSLSFQPSEFARFSMLIFLASYLSKRGKAKRFVKGFLPAFLILLLITGLVAFQPDISTASLIFMIGMGVLFYGGTRLRYLIAVSLLGLVLVISAIFKFEHARNRVEKFLNPDSNYQVVQAKIGIAEGKIIGVGVGKGKEKFLYLPAPHTDFIYAVIGEELGFVGGSFIIVLFLMLCHSGFGLAESTMRRDPFSSILAFGITLSFLVYAFSHMAVVLGLLPTTGLPLPFVSFGGSSLLFNLSSVGLLLAIERRRRERRISWER
jgi:cell division protein FtsW